MEVSFDGNENVLRYIVVMVAQLDEYTKSLESKCMLFGGSRV
jgi:hypothetical protein